MPDNNKNSTITLKIKQGQKIIERSLKANDKLTIGHSPENDIVVYGEHLPRKHTLIECGRGFCRFYLNKSMRGEIRYGNSRLDLHDLVVQEVLPKRGDFYSLQFPHGRSGHINIGDTVISFLYDGADTSLKGMPGYSWKKATGKALKHDLLFKVVFLFLLSLEVFFGFTLRNVEIPPPPPPDVAKVPERFAKFVIKQPPKKPETQIASTSGTESGTSDQKEGETKSQKAKKRKTSGGGGGGDAKESIATKGLLGLIGGKGQAAGASSVADFLIDQGLVQELDQLLGRKPLRKGRGRGSGKGSGIGGGEGTGDEIDDLMNIGLSGGIDDLISDVEGVETVNLTKKSSVNIQAPKQMRGSQAAMGQRSPDEVMAVINSQQGRIQYTYNKYLRKNPDLRGKISLDVTIEANGRISKVVVIESTIDNQDFINDIIRIIRRLKFRPIQEGSITINLPFVFNRFQ